MEDYCFWKHENNENPVLAEKQQNWKLSGVHVNTDRLSEDYWKRDTLGSSPFRGRKLC